nr:fimbrial protein [Paraburkholderia dipogonis]
MKSKISAIVIATGGLLGFASFGAYAADGTISFTGSVTDTTCSINGATAGTQADVAVTLAPVLNTSLGATGEVAGLSSPTDLQLKLTGCGSVTKAIANFENGSGVNQSSGNLLNIGGTAQNVEIQLLNSQMKPINVLTSQNNTLETDGAVVTGGASTLQYYAQYFATGAAKGGRSTLRFNTSCSISKQGSEALAMRASFLRSSFGIETGGR